jgi:hypothetical protein
MVKRLWNLGRIVLDIALLALAFYGGRNYDSFLSLGPTTETGRALVSSMQTDPNWQTWCGQLHHANLDVRVKKGWHKAVVVEHQEDLPLRGLSTADQVKLNEAFDAAYTSAERREIDARLKALHETGPAKQERTIIVKKD